MAESEWVCKHSSMVHEIETKCPGANIKHLSELALDVLCNCVSHNIYNTSVDHRTLYDISLLNTLLLPKHIIAEAVD